MELINVEMCENPVTISEYTAYNLKDLPKVILGFKIKNQFDEKRLKFKPLYDAKKISHFCQTQNLEPVFFYGVELTPSISQIQKLVTTLNRYSRNFLDCKTTEECVTKYTELLKEYHLSCENCFKYLADGIYPIDIFHLDKFINSDSKVPIYDLSSMLEISAEQWYLNISSLGIYVLGTCGSYVYNF